MKHDIIIVGGGPAGVMAALTSKDLGCDVAIIEGEDRICKKLLLTGNGRCNITNNNITLENYHSKNPLFYKSVSELFTLEDTISFFNSLGLPLTTLDDGKMYPLSLQASSVIDIFRMEIEEKSIPVYTASKIKFIRKEKNVFTIETINGEKFLANKVILACGGKSAPSTGSDGSGFKLAKALGHNIISTLPALVQLKLQYDHLKAITGVKFMGTAEAISENSVLQKEFGEILFTDYGISGPPILQLSRVCAVALELNKEVNLRLDLMPKLDYQELKILLESKWSLFQDRSIHDSLIGIVNKKLIPILLKEAGITDIHTPTSYVSWKEKQSIIKSLKEWSFRVIDTNSYKNAQVTAGGVDTTQVAFETMESRVMPKLFFAGEIIDVDGDCGGYNLQWAWTSGRIAGRGASLVI